MHVSFYANHTHRCKNASYLTYAIICSCDIRFVSSHIAIYIKIPFGKKSYLARKCTSAKSLFTVLTLNVVLLAIAMYMVLYGVAVGGSVKPVGEFAN